MLTNGFNPIIHPLLKRLGIAQPGRFYIFFSLHITYDKINTKRYDEGEYI